MKGVASSANIAASINETLLKKALVILGRRQKLYKNMNLYSLDQLSKVIEEINEQQTLKIRSTCITQTDDHNTTPYDNMMSMSEVKLTPIAQHNPSSLQQKHNKTSSSSTKWNPMRKQQHTNKPSFVELLEDEEYSRDYITNYHSIGKTQREEESAQIQAFRLIKQKEYQQMMKKKESEEKKKAPILINLNNQRVVYGYDSKVIKLQKMKERKSSNISQMTGVVPFEDSQKKQLYDLNRKGPTTITNKINITQKQAQQQKAKQKQKQRRAKRYHTSAVIEEPPTINITINPQSHKQIEQALSINHSGVKISIEKRQFSFNRYKNSNRTNRRLTKSEYLQIKSNQQLKQTTYYKHNDRIKFQSQGKLKTEYIKEEKTSSNSANKYKNSFHTFYNLKKKDQSKISIHSLDAKAQMLKQIKKQPFVFQKVQQNQSKQQQLSNVDRYNLLYLKYKGNPPQKIQQNLINALQSQSKLLRQAKTPLLLYGKSTNRENKVIRRKS